MKRFPRNPKAKTYKGTTIDFQESKSLSSKGQIIEIISEMFKNSNAISRKGTKISMVLKGQIGKGIGKISLNRITRKGKINIIKNTRVKQSKQTNEISVERKRRSIKEN